VATAMQGSGESCKFLILLDNRQVEQILLNWHPGRILRLIAAFDLDREAHGG
jgi:hypothetical protein